MVNDTRPTRADYYRVLADKLPAGALVVTSLGNASYLWAAMHHAPENFYVEDAMGAAGLEPSDSVGILARFQA